jgi:hypothetical protein
MKYSEERALIIFIFLPWRNTLNGPGPPYYRVLITTLSRTPLDEWSARRRDLYLTTHNTHNRHPCPPRDSNPQSQQASGRRPTPQTARPLRPAHFYYTCFISYSIPRFYVFEESGLWLVTKGK